MSAPHSCKKSGVCVVQAVTQTEIIVISSQLMCLSYDSKQHFSSSGLVNNGSFPYTSFPKFESENHILRGRKKWDERRLKNLTKLACKNTKSLKIGFTSTTTSDYVFFSVSLN